MSRPNIVDYLTIKLAEARCGASFTDATPRLDLLRSTAFQRAVAEPDLVAAVEAVERLADAFANGELPDEPEREEAPIDRAQLIDALAGTTDPFGTSPKEPEPVPRHWTPLSRDAFDD